jgi:predicted RNase H-like HicB family nuclease
MIFDFDEQEYVVFVDGIADIEGRGVTEQEAIDNFQDRMTKEFCL